MSDPLGTFDALERLRIPTHLAVDDRGTQAAFVTHSKDGAYWHVVDLRTSTMRSHPDRGSALGSLCWDTDGMLVAARGLLDGELETVVRLDPRDGAILTEVAVAGAIEQIESLGVGSWLVRTADPGSERDGMHLGTLVAGISGPRVDPVERRWRRLQIIDLDRGEVTALDTPGWTIWEASGNQSEVVAIASREPSPAGFYHPAVLHLDIATGEHRVLHHGTRQLTRPQLAEDGTAVVFIEGRSVVSGRLIRLDRRDGSTSVLTKAAEDDVWCPTSHPDPASPVEDITDVTIDGAGRWWLTGWDGLGCFVECRRSDGRACSARVHVDATILGRDAQPSVHPLPDDDAVVVALDTPDRPPELHLIDMATGQFHPLTDLHADWPGAEKDAVRAALRSLRRDDRCWNSTDGLEIHGELLRSGSTQTSGRRPAVLAVHGGPTWLWSRSFAPAESNGLAVPLATAGVAVLLPNPRGSSGRGRKYADAVAGDLGGGDRADLLAGLDQLIDDGIVDPERIAVIGTSYGGYMAAWLAATTTRFRCAIAFSPVADWCSFSRTSAIGGGFDAVYFPGVDPDTPAGREALIERSPAWNATGTHTPLLVLHGDEDRITPIGQAHELMHAWRRAGAEAALIRYPDEGHELTAPRWRHDAAQRVLAFLARHGILD